MINRPSVSLSLQQKNASKNLMRQLIQLLPLNDGQLLEKIRREIEQNPFLCFTPTPNNNTNFIETVQDTNQSIYSIATPQINQVFSNPNDHKIAMEILALTDNDGFLRDSITHLSTNAIDILERMQEMEPAGIFSRNLQEFYMAYLKMENKLTPLWKTFIQNLDKISIGEIDDSIRKMGTRDVFDAFMQDLKTLPHTPDINQSLATIITPDILCKKTKNGDFELTLTSHLHTHIDIDKNYVKSVRNATVKNTDKHFITEKFTAAKWLKKALEMRAEILLNITTLLIQEQIDFMHGGTLKPLKLSDIATLAGVHISTVSRIANNKYIQTPTGTYTLKKFFSYCTVGNISQDYILSELKTIIENEKNTGEILSDEKIAQIFIQKNIPIARRTIAKYREMCHIESSRIRKKTIHLRTNTHT